MKSATNAVAYKVAFDNKVVQDYKYIVAIPLHEWLWVPWVSNTKTSFLESPVLSTIPRTRSPLYLTAIDKNNGCEMKAGVSDNWLASQHCPHSVHPTWSVSGLPEDKQTDRQTDRQGRWGIMQGFLLWIGNQVLAWSGPDHRNFLQAL